MRSGFSVSSWRRRPQWINDWAWRKGHHNGTILCDLDRGKVIDLLAERSLESTERWLREHPGTEIISRDRASLYAQTVPMRRRKPCR